MMGTERWLVLPAQKALGYSVNTTDEDEMDQVKELLLEAKPHLLAYDDTTFYERLDQRRGRDGGGLGRLVQLRHRREPDIKFVVPEEGCDLWVGHDGDPEVLEEQGGGARLHRLHPRPEDPRLGRENILYKVPNTGGHGPGRRRPDRQYATLGARPEELLKGETIVDLGEAATALQPDHHRGHCV